MTAINPVTDLALDGEVAVITLNSPPVNALSLAVREGLHEAFTQALAGQAKAVVLICDGRTFIAGADISELSQMMQGPSLDAIEGLMENSPKPIVAAIHGTALGGGLEIALCAHQRVAVPSARLGLPEVNLGLLPGAGGTQRLPRLVGPEKALEMAATGRPVGARDALDMGLVDELVEEGKLRDGALAAARKAAAEGKTLTRLRDREDKIAAFRGKPEAFEAFRKANARTFRGLRAPLAAVEAVEAAVNLPFDEGLQVERKLFFELAMSPESAAQRYYFFAERNASKVPDLPEGTTAREIRKAGVIGAGTMGGGIAMTFANAGTPVAVLEMKPEALEHGLGVIKANYERSRGATPERTAQRMGLIQGTLNMADLADCDVIIEAVFENMDVKKDVFGKLDAIAKSGAVLASNTSFLNLDEIAAATKRPQDVAGLHFFSPANVMRLLEVVRGAKTSAETLATALAVGRLIGKTVVVSRVGHGFIANRVAEPYTRAAQLLLLAGASPAQIDKVLYAFGFPMGPFQTLDVVGLDVIKAPPGEASISAEFVAAGRRGQKGGGGFYDYDEARNPKPSAQADALVDAFRKAQGAEPREVSDEEILERSLYPMVNEGAKVLEEGIAIRASDIDVALVNGYGWPVYRGGPMYWADQVGLAKIVERLKAYQAQYGDAYKPSALLEKAAAEGQRLSKL